MNGITKEQLHQIEILFAQSAKGIHLLFDNKTIAEALVAPTEVSLEADAEATDADTNANIGATADEDGIMSGEASQSEGDFAELSQVQSVLAEFIKQGTLAQKHLFLKNLKPETSRLLIRTYFNIVENAIFETLEYKH